MFFKDEVSPQDVDHISNEILACIHETLNEPPCGADDIMPSEEMMRAMAFRATLSEDFALNSFRLRKWFDHAIATNQEFSSFQIDQWVYYIETENREIFLEKYTEKLLELEAYWEKWKKWQN